MQIEINTHTRRERKLNLNTQTYKSSLRECLKKLNQYLYENCKGNRDYDLKSNNEIAKVEQLEIEIGKSMMSSIF